MSSEAFTLQCYRCAGYFRAAAQPNSRVKCPHCAWVAQVVDFRHVRADELGSIETAEPASASVEIGADAWVQKGKHLQFGCPHCERPMRMLVEEAGGLADCPHCGLEIVSPDPQTGTGARLSDASKRRMGGGRGGRGSIKPRALREKVQQVPLDKAPSLEEAEQSLAAAQEELGGAVPNPFSASAVGEAPAERVAPVRMLGVEQLGAAFKARDELDAPNKLDWEADGAAPREHRIFSDRRGKIFATIAGVILALLGTMFIVLEFERRSEAAELARAGVEQVQAVRSAEDERLERAFDIARRAAGAKDWRSVLPLVRSRDRVDKVMAGYYAQRPFEAVSLVSRESAIDVENDEFDYLQLRVLDDAGRERLVGLQETPDGEFLFDWELWVNIASTQWEAFLEDRPAAVTMLRVTIARTSPLPRYVDDAGLASPEEVRCLRVWLNDSGASLVAVIPRSEQELAKLWDSMSWDLGRRVVAELSFPDGASQPDRVLVHRVVQSRWLLP